MCDTHALLSSDTVWFAKNSDREASEPQYLEYVAPLPLEANRAQQCSYIEVNLAEPQHAYYLSRPSWLWGGEMGVNEHGVCIGNEAIFSKCRSREPALLGMDLLRLGLASANTATAALEKITELLSEYGQGGPAGYENKKFHYDSSFLICDASGCWKLETAGRHWVAKYYSRPIKGFIAVSISNCLNIENDYDRCSDGLLEFAQQRGFWNGTSAFSFARCFDTQMLPWFARAKQRQQQNQNYLEDLTHSGRPPRWQDFARLLRQHKEPQKQSKKASLENPAHGSNADSCMHAGGPIRQSQTTASLITKLQAGHIQIAATGTSAPCLSLFRPLNFSAHRWSVIKPPQTKHGLWQQHEVVHRTALFNTALRANIKQQAGIIETQVFAALEQADTKKQAQQDALMEADDACKRWLQTMLLAAQEPTKKSILPLGYRQFWQRINNKDRLMQ